MTTGSCLCGAVSFSIACDLPSPDVCHCSRCRKFSGHCFASADVPRSALTVSGGDGLTWFRSSVKVRRGFCSTCGSSLFWDPLERDWIAVAMGAIDGATGTHLHAHIFTADKGDYYDISDTEPQE